MDSADHPPDDATRNPFAAHRADFTDPATGLLDYGRVINEVVALVRDIDPALNLSKLKSVRTSYDYRAVLVELSKETGRTVTATERAEGSGMGMLVHGKDDDVLALHQGLLDELFHDDPLRMRLAVNLIHHELSHAHDSAAKRKSFGDAWLSQPVTGVSNHLFPIADAVWCEYFANRRSYLTWPGSEHMHGPMFARQIPAARAAVKTAIRSFRRHVNVTHLLDDTMPQLNFLFMLTGYVMGTVHASGGSLEDVDAGAAAAMRGSYFESAWKALDIELDHLYQAHGQWPSGIGVYGPLEAIAGDVMVRLGLVLSVRNGRPYLDVPFTTDTLPGGV